MRSLHLLCAVSGRPLAGGRALPLREGPPRAPVSPPFALSELGGSSGFHISRRAAFAHPS